MENKLTLSNQICFPVYTLAKEIVNQYRPLLNDLDLTYPQYLVMLVLWEEQAQTVNQLGEKLKLDSGTLTPLLKRMAQKGLVTRNRDAADERVVNITLTKEGKKLKAKALCIPEQLVAAMNVSVKDLLILKNTIEKILSNYN